MKVSVVIPHRGSTIGLWSTVHSCEEALRDYDVSYEYVVISNGQPLPLDAAVCLKEVSKARPIVHLHFDEPLTPPVARQRGAAVAGGDVLAFFDNHCLAAKDYFTRALPQMESLGMLHSTTVFHAGVYAYHYKLKLRYNFWGESISTPVSQSEPYRLAIGGHGGFLVNKDVWDAVGGYGPEELFSGYGGEEPAFDLKLWRMGFSNWIDPKLIHYHFAGERGYTRHFTDEYYTNVLSSAMVIGGEKWLLRLLDSLTHRKHLRLRAQKPMFDLALDAYERCRAYADEVDRKSLKDLDTLLEWFEAEGVAM